ncbi:MAG: amino acid permease-domain-containing protein [Olpidium bornovanus]|uniref:Amino acid permease-domain-containing protein n=1 Tax=Olpidium bornovanus TaxID=278681 RepID=A0A8H7ZRV8_9FUNG|nr:MAG: amino acid permease-domain-containing protein [Olpidium bornovanus]
MKSWFGNLWARKSLDTLSREAGSDNKMNRALSALDLVMLGAGRKAARIGAIIGSGVFVLSGKVAADNAGPSVILSFVIAGVASAFAAFCYAEIASMIPVSGSAYTYTIATMGELPGWVIGWDLVLEYLVSVAAVAVSFSAYFQAFLRDAFGVVLPDVIRRSAVAYEFDKRTGHSYFSTHPGGVDLVAFVFTWAVTACVLFGVKESARVNGVVVVFKVVIILLVVCCSAPYVNPQNFSPFFPPNEGGLAFFFGLFLLFFTFLVLVLVFFAATRPVTFVWPPLPGDRCACAAVRPCGPGSFGKFGVTGTLQGATIIFFAYIGFDAVSTTSQEARNPQRDLPIGILGSLVICTGRARLLLPARRAGRQRTSAVTAARAFKHVSLSAFPCAPHPHFPTPLPPRFFPPAVLYILMAVILVGIQPYANYTGRADPITFAIQSLGPAWRWLSITVSLAALAGLTSVSLVNLIGQPRIFYSMAHDGLLPKVFAKIHPKFKTPWIPTILSGLAVSVLAGFLPIDVLAELTSVGTLFAFCLVSVAVGILRWRSTLGGGGPGRAGFRRGTIRPNSSARGPAHTSRLSFAVPAGVPRARPRAQVHCPVRLRFPRSLFLLQRHARRDRDPGHSVAPSGLAGHRPE